MSISLSNKLNWLHESTLSVAGNLLDNSIEIQGIIGEGYILAGDFSSLIVGI